MSGWGDAWRAVLRSSATDAQRRVAQGRSYHRSGRVLDLRWSPGALIARVQGSRATPYVVEVRVAVLDDAAWSRITDALAGQVRHSARLLAGAPPEGLGEGVLVAGVRLLPTRHELETTCGCADSAWRCAHVAALWEAGASELDEDPFLLLRLRGRGRARLLGEIADARRRRRATWKRPGVEVAGLPIDGWSAARSPLEDLGVPPPRPPATAAGALRLLGDPPGWRGGVSAHRLFGPMLVAGSHWIRTLDPTGERA